LRAFNEQATDAARSFETANRETASRKKSLPEELPRIGFLEKPKKEKTLDAWSGLALDQSENQN
jgi:hypothetical protein